VAIDRIIRGEAALLMELHQPDGWSWSSISRRSEDRVRVRGSTRRIGGALAVSDDEVVPLYYAHDQSDEGIAVGRRHDELMPRVRLAWRAERDRGATTLGGTLSFCDSIASLRIGHQHPGRGSHLRGVRTAPRD
jgi:hypothetical protein